MNLEFSFTSILDTAGVLQGLILGILLIILNKKKLKSTFFLGLFLIVYALQRIPHILAEVHAFDKYPELFLLPLTFLWIIYPLFFIYTQQISILQDAKTKYWLLYPGLLFYIFQIYIYFLPYETKLAIAPEPWFELCFFIGILFGWSVAIWNLKIISNHKIEVYNQFSMTRYKELRWARTFLIVSVIGSMIYLFQHFAMDKNIYSRIFFLIFDLTIIYWVSYHGVKQINVQSVLSKEDIFESTRSPIAIKNNTTTSKDKSSQYLMEQIDKYMTTSEEFINKELSITDLASKLNVHPKRISNTINTLRKKNFNSYVNQFRIHKAIAMLKSNMSINLSMDGIGKEVGFHSKSAFYAAFKKVTGTTPTKFIEKQAV